MYLYFMDTIDKEIVLGLGAVIWKEIFHGFLEFWENKDSIMSNTRIWFRNRSSIRLRFFNLVTKSI